MLYFYNVIIVHVGFHNLAVVSKEFFSRSFEASFGLFFPWYFSPQLFCLVLPSSKVLTIKHIQRENAGQTALVLLMLCFTSGLAGTSCPRA